jgi:hypothetical protein
MALTLEEWKNLFPVGSKVKTEFYHRERDKVRIVAEVCNAPTNSQNGVFLRTKCGLYCDIGWFDNYE